MQLAIHILWKGLTFRQRSVLMCAGLHPVPEEQHNMTKAELLEAIAKEAGTSKADAEKVLDAFFGSVVAGAKTGDKVAWPGFGSFSTTKRAARTGRNPQTGAA